MTDNAMTTWEKERRNTVRVLIDQLQENTGRHMLDSGDAYGRGYERWGRKGNAYAMAADYLSGPSVLVDKYGMTVSTIHHLAQGLTYIPKADRAFERWVERDDAKTGKESPWLVSAERFVAVACGHDVDTELSSIRGGSWGGEGPSVTNTYNFDNLLSETLQFIEFTSEMDKYGLVAGERYVLLQTHNGADARGGYSRPRVYSVESDFYICNVDISLWHPIEFPQEETLDLAVPERESYHGYSLYGGGDWCDRDGTFLSGEDAPQIDEELECYICPECLAPLSIELSGM